MSASNSMELSLNERVGLRRVASARGEIERIVALAELGFGGPTLADLACVMDMLQCASHELRSLVEEGGAS